MNQTGDMPSESDEERIARNQKRTERIEELERVDVQEDVGPEEETKRVKEAEILRRERFTDLEPDEKIGYLKQEVARLKEWAELEETTVEFDRIFREWGFIPTPDSLDSDLKSEIEKIKKENPWLVEEDRG